MPTTINLAAGESGGAVRLLARGLLGPQEAESAAAAAVGEPAAPIVLSAKKADQAALIVRSGRLLKVPKAVEAAVKAPAEAADRVAVAEVPAGAAGVEIAVDRGAMSRADRCRP